MGGPQWDWGDTQVKCTAPKQEPAEPPGALPRAPRGDIDHSLFALAVSSASTLSGVSREKRVLEKNVRNSPQILKLAQATALLSYSSGVHVKWML